MTERSESIPMPSPIPPPRAPTGSHAAIDVAPDVEVIWRTAQTAERVAREARDLARAAHVAIGRSPDPSNPRDEGTGILGTVAIIGAPGDPVRGTAPTGLVAITLRLDANVTKLKTTVEAWTAAQVEAATARARLVWAVGVPITVAALLGLGALAWRWISTLHH